MSAWRHDLKPFDALTPHELYAILRLRIDVFVVEQNCPFHETDDKDQHCLHLMLWDGDVLAAYARLVPRGISYADMSIGRVVTARSHRGTGLGKVLMEEAMQLCLQHYGPGPIRISAQCYARPFYERLGFAATGEVYLEDDIEHIEMVTN